MSNSIPRDHFLEKTSTAYPVFYRTYSRRGEVTEGERETWGQVCDRSIAGLVELGNLTPEEEALIRSEMESARSLPSGRWMWVGGTEWSKRPENFSGAYNCTSTNIVDWRSFGLMMDLAMMGCGTGAVLEQKYISQLPAIRNRLNVVVHGQPGDTPAGKRKEETQIRVLEGLAEDDDGEEVTILMITVGDSRKGWSTAYQTLLEYSTEELPTTQVDVIVDVSNVRPSGSRLRGFGGTANPVKLRDLFSRCARILNGAIGRQLDALECCLLLDEAAAVVVAGNVRRSAGIRQFDSKDEKAASAKDDLWQQDENGDWRIDPDRDVLRMANHTRVFHEKPTLDECLAAVRKQFCSGEGAIQWAGEAKKRAQGEGRYGLNPLSLAA